MVRVLGLALDLGTSVEQMDLEMEWRLFLGNDLAEELWVVLVVETIVRVGVDGLLVKLLIFLEMASLAPIIVSSVVKSAIVAAVVAPVVVVVASVVVATLATVISVAALSTLAIILIVIASAAVTPIAISTTATPIIVVASVVVATVTIIVVVLSWATVVTRIAIVVVAARFFGCAAWLVIRVRILIVCLRCGLVGGV